MIVPWYSHGIPMVFPWYSPIVNLQGFPGSAVFHRQRVFSTEGLEMLRRSAWNVRISRAKIWHEKKRMIFSHHLGVSIVMGLPK